MRKIFQKIVFLVVTILFANTIVVPATASPILPSRIAGIDRYDTSQKIASINGAKQTVIHGTGSIVDGVYATMFAVGMGKGFILHPPQLNPKNYDFLLDIDSVFSSLQGRDRFQTASNVTQALPSVTGKPVFVVNPYSEIDQITASVAAAVVGGGIVLAEPKLVGEVAKQEPSKVFVLGGENIVPSSILAPFSSKQIVRVAGADRYETAVRIAKNTVPKPDSVFIVNGVNPVDAISLAQLSAKTGTPVVYVQPTCSPQEVLQYISSIPQQTFIGGNEAVSQNVLKTRCPTREETQKAEEARLAELARIEAAQNPYGKQTPKGIAYDMLKDFGFGKDQMASLEALWERESGWNYLAYNRSSGAGGIPQALPASKMGTVGADWATNPATQIRWGLGYIKGRYGNPGAAWGHFLTKGWY